MAYRTVTRDQTTINLPEQGVTFDFVEQGKVKFTFEAGSIWRLPAHWHSRHTGCHQVEPIQGRIRSSFLTPEFHSGVSFGGRHEFKRGSTHVWSLDKPEQDRIALLTTDDDVLFRNMSGAVLDATRFPFLRSTPLWLRLLYLSFAFSPAAQKRIVAGLLWVQLQMMYHAHDFRVNHGAFGAVWLWRWTHLFDKSRPPQWVFRIQWWSICVRSAATHGVCYWFGRLLLGMRAEYLEYTPDGASFADCTAKETSLLP